MKTMSRCLIALMSCAVFCLQASAQGFFINNIDAAPVLSSTAADNVWYTDRYAPAAFEQVIFDGQNRLHHAISFNDALANRPAAYQSTFYNTQGRNFNVNNPTNTAVTADLYIGADWGSNHRRADLWSAFADAAGTMDWGVVGFANTEGNNPTFRAWDSNKGLWVDVATPIEYGKWYTLKIELVGSQINYYINGKSVYHYITTLTVTAVKTVLLQGYNFADHSLGDKQYSEDSYDIYWDNVGAITGIHNVTQDTYYLTLPAAVAAAQDGNTIELADGTYPITSTLAIGHGISITGQSEAGTIIDASAPTVTSWGINPKVSNISLSNLTIRPNGVNGGYPIHAGDDNVGPVPISNITLSHITIAGAYRSAFDFNGVTNLNVSYLTALNSSRGVGIAFSGCQNVTANHLATSGNAWGGLAIYTSVPVHRGSSDVTIDGTTSTFGETVGVYNQDENGMVNTNVVVNGYDYLVQNLSSKPGYTFYFASASDALAFAAALTPAAGTVVKQISTNMSVVSSQANITNLNPNVIFGDAKTTVQFTSLPAGANADVTLGSSTTQPAGTPPPPANAGIVGLYLNVTATGTISPFSATFTIDVSGITGFTANTVVMYFNNTTSTWEPLGSAGTYDAVNGTYTFTTDHFTTFSFVNPTNPLLVRLTVDPADPTKNVVYPHVGMGAPLSVADHDAFDWTPTGNDWTYKLDTLALYVMPTGSQAIIAANFKVKWDPAKLTLRYVTAGSVFPNKTFQASVVSGEVLINTASISGNVTSNGTDYLAKLTFANNTLGSGTVSLDNIDFRYYDEANNAQQGVLVSATNATFRMYLGDVASASPADQSFGDGKIDFNDLSPFAAAYWSAAPNSPYMSKYDIGPTNVNGSYFAMPKPDGKIEFEDLVIFAIGYGKSAANQLQKKQDKPAVFALGEREACGTEMRVPVSVSGGVSDLRALSLVLKSSAKLVRVEKAGELDAPNGFVIAKQEKGNIYIDAAMIGADAPAILKEGVIAYVVLQGSGSVSLSEVKARDSRNGELTTNAMKNGVGSIPEAFAISQNYPNPFNPSTTFSYELPKEAMVQIMVFNSLGQEVAVLVNEVKGAGYYNVSWNAAGMPSGVYYYQVKAGDVNVTKKMLLMK